MKLILTEGIPGSGKSTLAEMLYRTAQDSGLSASLFFEGSKNHPVHPCDDPRRRKTTEYFLNQWEDFVSKNVCTQHLYILEGSLFQSTVRFLMEANNELAVQSYFRQCEAILENCSAKLIYLRPPSISSHINWISHHRGDQWRSKVTAYLQATPYCLARNWREQDVQARFWSNYAALCDSLVLQATLPHCTMAAGVGYFELLYTQSTHFAGLDH